MSDYLNCSSKSRNCLDELEVIALHALDRLRLLGVEHAEASVSEGERLEVSVRQGEVELVKEAKSRGLTVRVVVSERVATSGTTDLSPEGIERFLRSVVEMAELSEADPLAMPPSRRELVTPGRLKDRELFDPRVGRIKASQAIKRAVAAERAAFRKDKRITSSEGASFVRGNSHSVLATSGGFVGRTLGSNLHLVVQVIADDEDGKKRNGVYWTAGRFVDELETPAAVGREAALRAVRSLGPTKMETGRYPIVFDKDASSGILGLLSSCVLGGSVYREQSYLAKRLGTQIASAKVTVVDDPTLVRGPGSRLFDGEGRAVRKNIVVKNGELRSFLLDTYSARKLRAKPTGSAGGGGGIPYSTTSNFVMKAGRVAPESLLKNIKRGLFVNSMMGFGFDSVTGDFSRGASGFMIEDGELTVPVSEVTISRNLDGLLHGIDLVANDLELRSSTAAPSFRVDEMTVSGS